MTPEQLYAAMDLPESALLGRRVFKKLFHENAALTAADKKGAYPARTGDLTPRHGRALGTIREGESTTSRSARIAKQHET